MHDLANIVTATDRAVEARLGHRVMESGVTYFEFESNAKDKVDGKHRATPKTQS